MTLAVMSGKGGVGKTNITLNTALAHLPMAAGDVVIPDVCGTGVNVIATKSAK